MITLTALDWLLAAVILFCAMRGFWRGAISQVFGIAGVLGGFLLAAYFHDNVAVPLHTALPKLTQPRMASFLLVFFLAWFCIGTAGYWLSGLLRRTGLSSLDRLGGLAVGLVKALAIASVAISLLTFFLPPQNLILRQSVLAPYVCEGSRLLLEATPKSLRDSFDKKREELKRYWEKRKGAI